MSKLIMSACLLVTVAACIAAPSPPGGTIPPSVPARPSYTYHMPIIAKNAPIHAADASCGQSPEAQQLAFLFTSDTKQHRVHPHCDSRLVQAAMYRANDMADKQYFGHVDKEGKTPDAIAIQFGCVLPDYYGSGNHIESLGLNLPSAQGVWDAWKLSPGHRAHVLGTIDFWKQQTSYGAAVVESAWGKVWVMLSAPGCEG